MAKRFPTAMLFVRCAGGVSHHPDEAVSEADVAAALDVLLAVRDETGGAKTSATDANSPFARPRALVPAPLVSIMEPIRSLPFGTTRSRVTRNYALITPDTHVSFAVGRLAECVGGGAHRAGNGRAIHAVHGHAGKRCGTVPRRARASSDSCLCSMARCTLKSRPKQQDLGAGQFAFHSAGYAARDSRPADGESRRRGWRCSKSVISPARGRPARAHRPSKRRARRSVSRRSSAAAASAAAGRAGSSTWPCNIFTYDAGGHLPQVEIHVMEHGLLMLDGTGVYRLGDEWFPVQAGDVIWMASYCPQWFVAMGKKPARYLYYKDIHRDRLSEK